MSDTCGIWVESFHLHRQGKRKYRDQYGCDRDRFLSTYFCFKFCDSIPPTSIISQGFPFFAQAALITTTATSLSCR